MRPHKVVILLCLLLASGSAFADGRSRVPHRTTPASAGAADDLRGALEPRADHRAGPVANAAGPTAAMPVREPWIQADTTLGLSGRLRVHLLPPGAAATGVYRVPAGVNGNPYAFLGLVPFARKRGSWLGNYLLGMWPAELHGVTSAAYANPSGFVEVTPNNLDLPLSEHFRLGDFVTHDAQPFPRYVVLREELLDKLELVLADLALHGVPTQRVVVLSGFRTPAHNLSLGDASGRARESRHQYGDAADLIIDADGDGRMDDLNNDGRVDAGDVRVIEAAVNRVEMEHPQLAGGLGLYETMGPSGPFAHIDVRGTRARWGTAARPPLPPSYARTSDAWHAAGTGREGQATAVGHCYAEGPSAVLCQGFRHPH